MRVCTSLTPAPPTDALERTPEVTVAPGKQPSRRATAPQFLHDGDRDSWSAASDAVPSTTGKPCGEGRWSESLSERLTIAWSSSACYDALRYGFSSMFDARSASATIDCSAPFNFAKAANDVGAR